MEKKKEAGGLDVSVAGGLHDAPFIEVRLIDGTPPLSFVI